MTSLDIFMLGFIVVVAVGFLLWFVKELNSEDEK